MSQEINVVDSSDSNKNDISIGKPTSLESEAEFEEDTLAQFNFVEETLQITDVHDSSDVTVSLDANSNPADESASCSDANLHENTTSAELDYLNYSQEHQIQSSKLNSVDFDFLNSSKLKTKSFHELESPMAELITNNETSQLVVEKEDFCVGDNISEVNDLVCQETKDFVGKGVDEQQYMDGSGYYNNEAICSDVDENEQFINNETCHNQSSSSEKGFSVLNTSGIKLENIIKESILDEFGGSENIEGLIEELSITECVNVPKTQNEDESSRDNIIKLKKDSFVGSVLKETELDNSCSENICSSKVRSNFCASQDHLEEKVDSDCNKTTEIVDLENNFFENIVSQGENIDFCLMDQSYDKYSTSTDESNSDVFEDAVDSPPERTIQKDCTKTEFNDNGYRCNEVSSLQNEAGQNLEETSLLEPFADFCDDLFSCHTNKSNVSETSFLSHPSEGDSFQCSYLVQEPLVILETNNSNLSNEEAESFALTDVHFMQISSHEIVEDAEEVFVKIDQIEDVKVYDTVDPMSLENLPPVSQDANIFSVTPTELESNDSLILNRNDTTHNFSNSSLSQDLNCMARLMKTPTVCDIEDQLKLSNIKMNSSTVLDNNMQTLANITPSEECSGKVLRLDVDVYQPKHEEMIDDVKIQVEDKSGKQKSSLASFEVIEMQETITALRRPSVVIERGCFIKENVVLNEISILDSEVNLTSEINPKELTQRDMSMILSEDKLEQSVHGSDSHDSCNTDNGLTHILDTTNTNHLQEQNQSCQSPGISSLSVTDFIDNIVTNETNDFSSEGDQKSSDVVYVISSSDSNENSSQFLTDHGLHSFMEMTMANVNPAMYEQSILIDHTGKRSSISNVFKDSVIEDQDSNKSLIISQGEKEIKSSDVEDLDTSFQSESGNSTENISHEIMQQSMCDYVTNQVLQLTIPDSDGFVEIDHSNEDVNNQCERQIENVLLMKWPPQFYDQLKTLQEQNLILTDQVKMEQSKVLNITSIQLDNKRLVETVEEQLRQLNEDKLVITGLQNQNKELTCDLECLKTIQNDLINFKTDNEKLQLNIESITKEKELEFKALSGKIEELQQKLISVDEIVETLQIKNEALSNLSNDMNVKDEQIRILVEDKSALANLIKDLNERIEEYSGLERANKLLNSALQQETQRTAEADKLKFSLQEQVSNLTTQNELLWQELKVSTTKEQALYVVNEEKLILEERLVLLKRGVEELDKLKLENKQLIEKLNGRDYDICSLTDDKKKLKNSLKKANDKLNDFESENEYLTEETKELKFKISELHSQALTLEETKKEIELEKQSLQSTLNDVLQSKEEQNRSIECERIAIYESASSVGESIMNLMMEREWLSEQVSNNENKILSMEQENQLLKNRLSNGKTSLECIQTQNITLLDQLACLQNKVDSLTKELNIKEKQCFNIVEVQKENMQLSLQVKSLIEDITSFECEKESAMKDMSSLSEAVSNVLIDKEVLFCQLTEASKTVDKLLSDKEQLKEQVSNMESTLNDFQQSKSALLIQLQNANEKDGVIESNEELIRELEIHISSLNEELLNEISKQDLLEIDSISLKSRIDELEAQNSLLQRQIADALEQNQAVNKLRNDQQSLKICIEELSEKSRTLQEENSLINDELQKQKETTNNLRNSNLNLANLLESKSNEKNTLVQQVEHLEEQICKLQLSNSSLKSEIEISKEKDVEINELKDLITELEQHVSSLNEELFSEMSKHDFLLFAKETLEFQITEIEKEKCSAIATLKTVSESIVHLESENNELKNELRDTVSKLRDENQRLLQVQKEVEIKLQSVIDEKVKLESELNEKIELLEQNEGMIRVLRDNQECDVNNSVQLREVMMKEISSLSGTNDSGNLESLSLLEVYRKLMEEFLGKEREVIFTIQNEYENKKTNMLNEVTNLQSILQDKDSLSLKLEQEIKELKEQLNEHKTITLELNSNLQDIKNEFKTKEQQIEEIKKTLTQVEQDKEGLVAELKSMQHFEVDPKLEEEVLFLNNEVQCKNIEISDLRSEIEKLKIKEVDFVKLLEGEKEIVHQHQETMDRLREELNSKEESIAKLELQLLTKSSEVEQINNYLELKKKEREEYEKKVESLLPAAVELSQIKEDIATIEKHFNSMNGESDLGKVLLETAQSCQILDGIVKAMCDQSMKCVSKLQLCNTDLKSQLLKRVDECKLMETQINCINEELKAHRLLYDEDILQFKEEVVNKDQTISKLNNEITQLKVDHAIVLEKLKDVENSGLEVGQLKLEIKQLKEENVKLIEDYSKFNVFKEVNRKLTLEIEELSRSIKFEKQSNNELKSKYDLVSNQLADSKKKNFGLEDKIEVLENRLQNQNLMKSLKIVFPVGIDDIDKQVLFINEKLVEYERQKEKLQHLIDEHNVLKHEHDKSSEFIKKQEEKMSKILKRELDLKKQIASVNHTNTTEVKLLEKVKAELFSFFPEQPSSLPEGIVKIRNLLEESKLHKNVNPVDIEELNKRLEEAQQENKDLDNECEMMNKHITEQEEQLISVLKREEELKKENEDLKAKIGSQNQPSNESLEASLKELLLAFPEKPTSIKTALDLIKTTLVENQTLTERITEAQEEYASLDKECEEMFKAYQLKENELVDVLKREAKCSSEFESKAAKMTELQNQVLLLTEELERSKSEKLLITPAKCQCDELSSRLKELKVDLADRNAKITALELQFEADNFPFKKKASDLEKSLDQAKQKNSELKAEVRRYQEQMHEVTVGLRTDCEGCRRNNATRSELSVQTSPSTVDFGDQLAHKTKEIAILKALCKSRNQRIAELEQGSLKVPRPHRSALKPGKENSNMTLSPTKSTKGNNAF